MTEIDDLYATLRPQLKGVSAREYRDAMHGLDDALAATPRPRTQLTLRRLCFHGAKSGDFRFFPGVNVLRAGNDKGKSSILKLIHFCLTGRNELKKDVDSWIDDVELYFELSGHPHAILVHKRGRIRGRLVRCRPDLPEEAQLGEILLEWPSAKAMQTELETFMNQAFGLRPLMGTQKDSRKGSDALLDAPTSYRAYVRGLYINQDMGYTDLITDGIPYGNLFFKIVGMLLGMRGIDAFFAVEARLAHIENLLGKEERYHRRVEESLGLRDLATLDEEIGKLERYIDELKVERTALFVRATSSDLDHRLTELTDRLVLLESGRQQTHRSQKEAEADLEASEREIAELEAAILSRDILGAIVPERWPFFDIELTEAQRAAAAAQLGQHGQEFLRIAQERLQQAKRAAISQRRTVERRRAELQELEFRTDQTAQQKRHLQAQLKSAHQGTGELDREIELETRYLGRLEAEREAAVRMVSEGGAGSSIQKLLKAKTILDAVLRDLRLQDSVVNERIKQEFARRVLDYCTTIGFPGLEDITFDPQLKPRISQNGKVYNFDELSPGEKVRFVLAFYLGLALFTAEEHSGAHPGLLLIDSPGKEEMVAGDFEAVVNLLSQVEINHAPKIQVVVATTIPAIRGATKISKQTFVTDDDEPIFG